jgi:hypothetical protein
MGRRAHPWVAGEKACFQEKAALLGFRRPASPAWGPVTMILSLFRWGEVHGTRRPILYSYYVRSHTAGVGWSGWMDRIAVRLCWTRVRLGGRHEGGVPTRSTAGGGGGGAAVAERYARWSWSWGVVIGGKVGATGVPVGATPARGHVVVTLGP